MALDLSDREKAESVRCARAEDVLNRKHNPRVVGRQNSAWKAETIVAGLIAHQLSKLPSKRSHVA